MNTVVMRRDHAKSETASVLDRAALNGYTAVDPDDAALCARMIARYARTPDEGDLIADILGLDAGVRFWNAQQVADRIMRLADSIGGTGMTALAVTGIIASGFLSALGDVLLSALHITDVILGYFTMTALATLPLASAIGRRLKRQEPLRVVVTGAVPEEWTRDGEVGDDLPGWVNGGSDEDD